jgi:hypothetical protein
VDGKRPGDSLGEELFDASAILNSFTPYKRVFSSLSINGADGFAKMSDNSGT